MNRITYLTFLEYWYPVTSFLGIVLFICALSTAFAYFIWLKREPNPSIKFKVVSKYENKYTKYLLILFLVSLFLGLNQLFPSVIRIYGAWFIIRIAVSGAIGSFLYYVITILLEVYFSDRRILRLNKLRYAPRLSNSGNSMRLLSEDEEDVYLNEGMQAEEEVLSIDYDVWIDDTTGEIRIEKYLGRSFSARCPSCGYYTLKTVKEIIMSPPTYSQKGQLMKILKCHYCHHSERKYFSYITSLKTE